MRPQSPAGRPSGILDKVFRFAMFAVPVGVLLNLAISWRLTDEEVLRNLWAGDRRYLYLAVLLALIPWFTNALRLLIWTRFLGDRIRFRDTFRITLGAELASSVLPTSTGGEVFRWGLMVQKGISQGRAASIITLGYVEDAIFFAVALPASIVLSRAWELPALRFLGRQIQGRALVVGGILLVTLFVLRVVWRMVLLGRLGERPRERGLRIAAGVRRRLRKTWSDFRSAYRLVIRRGKALFLIALLITAVQWASRYSVATALVYFLGAEVDPLLFFLLQWVIFTAMLFIPTPGASGGAEAAFLLVYSALLPAGIIGVATAGWRLLTFYFQLALGSVLFTLLNVEDARRSGPEGRAHGTPEGVDNSGGRDAQVQH